MLEVGVFVMLPVDGIVGADDSDIWIDPTSIRFGTVIVGMQTGGAVTLWNGGDAYGPIIITGGEPPTAEFELQETCSGTTLGPGGACSIGFGFRPSGGGIFNDVSTFVVSEPGSAGAEFTVTLFGTGEDQSTTTSSSTTVATIATTISSSTTTAVPSTMTTTTDTLNTAPIATTAPTDAPNTPAVTTNITTTVDAEPMSMLGHAQVIAQAVLPFEHAVYTWSDEALIARTTPTVVAGGNPAFVVADGGTSLLVSVGGVPIGRLENGEGLLLPAAGASVQSNTDADAIVLRADLGDGESSFEPGAGMRDVDLVRDVLDPGEELRLSAELSGYFFVTHAELSDGTTTYDRDDGGTAFEGEITLYNDQDDPAIVLVAIVGPPVGAIAG